MFLPGCRRRWGCFRPRDDLLSHILSSRSTSITFPGESRHLYLWPTRKASKWRDQRVLLLNCLTAEPVAAVIDGRTLRTAASRSCRPRRFRLVGTAFLFLDTPNDGVRPPDLPASLRGVSARGRELPPWRFFPETLRVVGFSVKLTCTVSNGQMDLCFNLFVRCFV